MLHFFTSRRTDGVLLLLAAGSVLSAGCQVYDPSLVSRDAGRPGACTGRRPIARPDTSDGAGQEIIFGLREVVLDQTENALFADLGFNLDGICTGAPEFARECRPGEGGGRAPTDGNEGIDNVFGSELFPLVDTVVDGLEDTARARQREGIGLPVLRVRDWNGESNDPRVSVTITQAVVTVPAADDGSAPEIVIEDYVAELPDGSRAPSPDWDGRDYTWVRADTFLAGNTDDPLVYDNNAYIADDQLVVTLPDRVEILFPADDVGVMVRLTGGILVGRMNADRTLLEDVIVAGRWSITDLLRTAENVGVCMGSIEYNVLRGRLRAIADVHSNVTTDDPTLECDAVSMGVGFTGYRLNLGGVTEGRPLLSACDMQDGGVPGQDGGVPMDGGS